MAPLDSGRDSGRRSPTMSGALHRNSSTESLLGLEQQQVRLTHPGRGGGKRL
jgi:hypothetical protein